MGEMNWLLFPNHTQELLILDTYGEKVNSYELFFKFEMSAGISN